MRLWNGMLFAATATASLAACDPQSDPDYQGEALATIRGEITNNATGEVPPAEVTLFWTVSAGSPDYYVDTKVSVQGDFPAAFEMNLFAPPPDEALNDYTRGGDFPDETRIGVAHILVTEADAETIDDDGTGVLGGVEHYLLIYAEADVKAGSRTAGLLHGALSAGYHLMRAEAPTCEGEDCQPESTFDQLFEAPQGFDTELEAIIVDEIDDLDLPEWT